VRHRERCLFNHGKSGSTFLHEWSPECSERADGPQRMRALQTVCPIKKDTLIWLRHSAPLPTRHAPRIIYGLSEQPLCVCDLAQVVGISEPAVWALFSSPWRMDCSRHGPGYVSRRGRNEIFALLPAVSLTGGRAEDRERHDHARRCR